MAELAKYGVARHYYFPMIKRGAVDFAVGADWTPAAGDVKISKDGAAVANVTNLPTAIASGNGAFWDFSMTATEMQAAQIMVTVVDAATKAVEDQSFRIDTYGNASAQHPFDLGTASTAQTGDVTTAIDILQGDESIDKTTPTQWQQVIKKKSTATEIVRKKLYKSDGSTKITADTDIVGQRTET